MAWKDAQELALQRHLGKLKFGRLLLCASALVAGASVLANGTSGAAPIAVPHAAATLPSPARVMQASDAQFGRMLGEYCSRCHNDFDQIGGFSTESLRASDIAEGRNIANWEKVLRRIDNREMPPANRPQPPAELRAAFVDWLAHGRNSFAAANPDPGQLVLRRLNRAEYGNAVRDLLGVEVDVAQDLPRDNSGFGFDNVADVLSVSPTLMENYIAVAGKVSRMATGLASQRALVTSYQVPKDGSVLNTGIPAYNERSSPLLPVASRGGGAFTYFARYDGLYDITGWLNANTNNETDRMVEDRYTVRVPLKAGPRLIGMSFRRTTAPDESVETVRNDTSYVPLPLDKPRDLTLDVWVDGLRAGQLAVPSYRLHERYSQQNFPRDVLQIDVAGPHGALGAGNTPSRDLIFTCKPTRAAQEGGCARQILTGLVRRAYRRPVSEGDLAPLLAIYAAERAENGFEPGIQAAIEAILVSPHFLFLIERDAPDAAPGSPARISDLELASRLSLFLWSSIPDEPLLALAEQGRLRDPKVLEAEIARMLKDPRARALTDNFAGQWLYLRNLAEQRPDITVFPEFDARLRAAMAGETEMFFTHVLQTNASVLDFIKADYTFLNQRLADHYGIPGVKGTAMRKVALDPAWQRGGLLGQASILTVTSYGNHTSVVKRGKWVLDNILAAPPPPAPPNVPALKAEQDGRKLSARAQLELHRADPACASCHMAMDPLGFALENYDAVGAWRRLDAGEVIDASATLPNGTRISGLDGLQAVLMERRQEFVRAFTERLMTYALARGVGPQDMPTIRRIEREAAGEGYRIQTIIAGIVTSDAFTLRKAAKPAAMAARSTDP
jgi:Protein of unknown function (DUF1592)/Protein of unknown function (DUF1588)/Protein of unknown function (DUF1587)/Protein of unknown function (DUF1585)/Protein of unknown function (DUF1595)